MLKVLDLNMWNRNDPYPERMAILGNFVRVKKPDVVLFQEVLFTDNSDQASDVLGDDYRVFAVPTYECGDHREGVALAIRNRYQLQHPTAVELPCEPDEPGRKVAMAIVQHSDGQTMFAVTHLAFRREHDDLRSAQAKVAVDAMADYRSEHGVSACALGLDANAAPDSAALDILRGAGLSDSLPRTQADRPTWTGSNPYVPDDQAGQREDYILTSGFSSARARIVLDESPFPSDHYGIWASLR